MAEQRIDVKIIQRNDTSANWTAKNPILLKGEFGIESDTNKIKIGDGTTEWKTLSYAIDDSASNAGFSVGPAPPTDKSVLWVDTSANADETSFHVLNFKDSATDSLVGLKIMDGRLQLEDVVLPPEEDRTVAYYYNLLDFATNKTYEFCIRDSRIELKEKGVTS